MRGMSQGAPWEGWEGGGGTPSPLPSWVPSCHAGNESETIKANRAPGWDISTWPPEKLLEIFEAFQVEQILSEVKKEWVFDEGVSEFGELLEEERKRLKQAAQAAQAARATYVREHWTPGCYPQLTTDWFVEGLDFCCPYWRYEFKRPLTPPPAPPPSPDASRKRMLPFHLPLHETPHHDLPTKRRRRRRR